MESDHLIIGLLNNFQLSLTSTVLSGASVVSTVVGPEDIATPRLEKLYRDTVRSSGGKSLSLLSIQVYSQ